MYAVIFRAEADQLDDDYFEMALAMRELAINDYGCSEFTSVAEHGYEIAISYWQDLEQIKRWKQAAEHLQAQQSGKTRWYRNYHVQVVEILREYGSA